MYRVLKNEYETDWEAAEGGFTLVKYFETRKEAEEYVNQHPDKCRYLIIAT